MAHAVFAKVDAVGDADATFNLANMLEYWFGWRKHLRGRIQLVLCADRRSAEQVYCVSLCLAHPGLEWPGRGTDSLKTEIVQDSALIDLILQNREVPCVFAVVV